MLAVRTRLPTIFETNEVEEMWPAEVENALLEAMVIYPPCGKKLIKHNNGEKYGRNHLIAYYIKKKCGKTRTPKQISSHMQFLVKKQKVILNLPLSSMNSQIFDKDMVDYKHSSDLVFIITQELNEQLFEVMDESTLKTLHKNLALRKISTSKIGVLGFFFAKLEEKCKNKSILSGIAYTLDARISDINYKEISYLFDDTMSKLLETVSLDSFYLVKSWVNLNFCVTKNLLSNHQIFYSPYKFDISMNVHFYFRGKHLWTFDCDSLAVDEVIIQNSTFYIYHMEYSPSEFGKIFMGSLIKLYKSQGKEIVDKIYRQHAMLLILKDQQTQEVLLVMPMIYKFDPIFSGYQLYRLKS